MIATSGQVADRRFPVADVIFEAVYGVTDPEYPDISIIDLGLLETLDTLPSGCGAERLTVRVGLIPTFSGCPALAMIADDVRSAVEKLPAVDACEVTWLSSPTWSTNRVGAAAQKRLSSDYTVVLRRKNGSLRCPVCGSDAVTDQSSAGPTRCRSVAWCTNCRNVVEVMR